MNTGQLIYIASRLVVNALAVFFATVLWSKTRDPAWTLVVIGVIALYAETMYVLLEFFGIAGPGILSVGSTSPLGILLSTIPAVIFAAAFLVKVIRKHRFY
jgi:hypothetical protein